MNSASRNVFFSEMCFSLLHLVHFLFNWSKLDFISFICKLRYWHLFSFYAIQVFSSLFISPLLQPGLMAFCTELLPPFLFFQWNWLIFWHLTNSCLWLVICPFICPLLDSSSVYFYCLLLIFFSGNPSTSTMV